MARSGYLLGIFVLLSLFIQIYLIKLFVYVLYHRLVVMTDTICAKDTNNGNELVFVYEHSKLVYTRLIIIIMIYKIITYFIFAIGIYLEIILYLYCYLKII